MTLPADVRVVTTHAELARLTGYASVVRLEVAHAPGTALHRDGATLLRRLTQTGGPDLVGLGPAAALRELLHDVAHQLPEDLAAPGITVEAANRAVAEEIGSPDGGSWQVMACTGGPLDTALDIPHASGLTPVEPGTDRHDEILHLLDTHYTSEWTRPGAHVGERWHGYEQAGRLVAVGCASLTPAGYVRLGGITVDSSLRGRGVGRALTAWLTRTGLAHRDTVTLGLDAGNPAAEHLYRSLGYTTAHAWWSTHLR